MSSTEAILNELRSSARPSNLKGMASYGMTVEKRLGVSVPDMRRIARRIGKDHVLAGRLWKTGIAEARIVACMIADPEKMSAREMDAWVRGLDSWDVCDQVCMNLFEKSPFARQKIAEWSGRKEEFVKRAAFALIACLAWHDKTAPDRLFVGFLPVIKRGATDERGYVKKAVSWALRNIGKRNAALHKHALKTAREIERMESDAARWIAADAIRELERVGGKKRSAEQG